MNHTNIIDKLRNLDSRKITTISNALEDVFFTNGKKATLFQYILAFGTLLIFTFIIIFLMLIILYPLINTTAGGLNNAMLVTLYYILFISIKEQIIDGKSCDFTIGIARLMDHAIAIVAIHYIFIFFTPSSEIRIYDYIVLIVLMKFFARGYIAMYLKASLKYVVFFAAIVLLSYSINEEAVRTLFVEGVKLINQLRS